MDRRGFLRLALAGLAGLAWPGRGLYTPGPALALPPWHPDRLFVGEELNFDISFWWFDRVGTVIMRFQRLSQGRGYLAEVAGQTLGLIGLFTAFRRDSYRTFMTFDRAAQRLAPYHFEEEVVIGRELFRAVRDFDHRRQEIVYRRARKSGQVKVRRDEMPSPWTVDYLTAFYNMRAGVYGPVLPGREFIIPTIPNQGSEEIRVSILSREEIEAKRRQSGSSLPLYGYIQMDPKLLRSEKGLIHGWFSQDLVPVEGTLYKIRVFGDIKGWLTARARVAEESQAQPAGPAENKPVQKNVRGA